jgi:hypothetical protein
MPSRDHLPENRRIFPDDIEQTITQFIRVNFLAQGRPLDHPRLQPLIHILVHHFVAGRNLSAGWLNFKCSYDFMSRFLVRANLSFRKTRPTKRATIDDEACAHFLVQLAAVQAECPVQRILSLGESSWRLVMAPEKSIAERGAEFIPRFTGADSKTCFTFLATCAADGSKFPLILLAKGKTECCRKQFGSVGHPHEVWHSPNGWCCEDLVVDYLYWFRNWFLDGQLCYIMDQFSTHTTDQVLSTATKLRIEISWIPDKEEEANYKDDEELEHESLFILEMFDNVRKKISKSIGSLLA